MARLWVAAVAVLGLAGEVNAQTPPLRFKWTPGQTQTYRVAQQTTVTETAVEGTDNKATTATHGTDLQLTKVWAVKEVDAAGVATLQMTIAAMKQTIRQADGMTRVIDSTNADDARQMADYLNKPVLTVRVDAQGRLVEVKEAKTGSTARLQAELPFRVTLPDAGPADGQAWDRPFAIKLDPPLGTGESFDAVQKYTYKGATGGAAVVGVETTLKAAAMPADMVPLAPLLWKGDVYLNAAGGKLHAVRLEAKAEVVGHQGPGSKFVYSSTYAEDAADPK